MKLITFCIKKNALTKLPQVLSFAKESKADQIVILLMDQYIIRQAGLRKLLPILSKETTLPIHLIHLGLAFDMSVNDYRRIFSEFPPFQMETELKLPVGDGKADIEFHSNDIEDCRWDDQGYNTLLGLTKGPNLYVTAVRRPTSGSYMDDWGRGAWRLSARPDNYLLYLDDGDVVQIETGENILVTAVHERNGTLQLGRVVKDLKI